MFSSLYIFGQTSYHLPKVLFLTTGADEGRGTVSDGIVVALEAFNRLGTTVRLENREVLLQPDILAAFDIMIVPTIKGYHDKPQDYSLTYMSDIELKNIALWVKNGGTLVTDVNIGRNTLEGEDRFIKDKILNVNNWELGRCFGVALKEINTDNLAIRETDLDIWHHDIMKPKNKEIWRLIAVKKAPRVRVLAKWENTTVNYPAITLNNYGKGNSFLLPTFYVLHPLSDGGLSTKKEIYAFYKYVYETALGNRKYPMQFLPWKNGHTSVYCQTFDDGGNAEEYDRIFNFIEKNQLPTVFFVTPHIDKNIAEKIKKQAYISIQGHSYNHPDFRKLDYFKTISEFLMNRQYWNKKFKGFRFPYVSNSFWGMYLLDKLDFEYETSIAANNLDFIRGSVVPYNIPVFNDEFYATLDLLEISQIYRSDWYFYKKILDNDPYTPEEQKQDANNFETYLFEYYNKVVKPVNGVMVYLGHPMYSGKSETTLRPLQKFIDYLKENNVWIASLNEVAARWNKLEKMNVKIEENGHQVTLTVDLQGQTIEDLTIKLSAKPVEVTYNGNYHLTNIDGDEYLIIDLENSNTIYLRF